MSELKVGYAKRIITPQVGCYLQGNMTERIAQEVGDPLYARCVMFENEGTAVLIELDLVSISMQLANEIRDFTAQSLGCARKDVFVACTHTHTGPVVQKDGDFPMEENLCKSLPYLAASAAWGAKNDLHPAQMFFASDTLPGLAFIRRYRMKDGTVRTNPGRHNPDVVGPVTEGDDSIRLLRIVREGAGDVLLVSFQCHPDVVKNYAPFPVISADYPGFVCRTLEGALPGADVMYCNGPCGDLNHVDVNCPEWDRNGGMEHGAHMGRTIAGKVLSLYTKARPIEAGKVRTIERDVDIAVRTPTPEEIAAAEKTVREVDAGDYSNIPFKPHSMEFITVAYEARMRLDVRQYHGHLPTNVSAFRVGELAVAGVAGEAFCAIGKRIRAESPFPAQLALGITNGCNGYFPMKDAFEVNGYESRTSKFCPGVGETLADAAVELLRELAKEE